MGAIKELYFSLIELISNLLDGEIEESELDAYMEENLTLSEYRFYIENKDILIKEADALADQTHHELPGARDWTRSDFKRHGIDTSNISDDDIDEALVSGDSPQKRSIDLRGPSGNAFVILGMAHELAKQLQKVNPSYNWDKIQKEMTSGDYKHLVETFEEYFGDYVTIYNADVIDESFNGINEGSDWIYLKSIDMYLDEYTGNFLDKDQPMEVFVEPGDNEYEELVSKLDSHDKTIHREVMTGTSDDEYENGQRYPGDNEVPVDDDDEWFDPAGGRHRGDDDEPWKMYEAEDEEYLMPPLNEGCNCGGKKRPRPTIVRRPTNVVILPTRKKLHESEDLSEAKNNWYFKPSLWAISQANSEKRKFLKIHPNAKVTISGRDGFVRVNGNIAYDISSMIGNNQKYDYQEKLEKAYHESMNESKTTDILMSPVNEVDYEAMARMNRETDKAPRFVGGMSKYIAPKERKTAEKSEYDYSERKEGLGRIARKHRIMKDMGYDLDSEIEMPELAPTKREFGKLRKFNTSKFRKTDPNRFNMLKGELGQEERETNKFFKRHLRNKSFD